MDGFGDPRLRLAVNLYGAPALSLEEFAAYHQDLIVGASVQVSAPLGQYDAHRLLNIGTNRWAVKPEVGVSKALGRFTLEFLPGVTFFTDNPDFLGRTRARDPIYSVQGHLIYSFRAGLWGAVDGTYYGADARPSTAGREATGWTTRASAAPSRCPSTSTTRSSSTPVPVSRPAPARASIRSASPGSIAGAEGSSRAWTRPRVQGPLRTPSRASGYAA